LYDGEVTTILAVANKTDEGTAVDATAESAFTGESSTEDDDGTALAEIV